MFGYVNANIAGLDEDAKARYRGYYCGLCRTLGNEYGIRAKLTLNFDMAFLAMFLSSYFNANETVENKSCALHPFSKHREITNKFTEYAASMNILLTFHKLADDICDDNSQSARISKAVLNKAYNKADKEYPAKNSAIQRQLTELADIEKHDEHNPDIPASAFGVIMSELFDIYNNDALLRGFGFALGKAIYILDACVDFKSDLKKCRYNPLVETSSANFQQILTILLSDCTNIYDKMNITKNNDIIENILYSGIWTRFKEMNK